MMAQTRRHTRLVGWWCPLSVSSVRQTMPAPQRAISETTIPPAVCVHYRPLQRTPTHNSTYHCEGVVLAIHEPSYIFRILGDSTSSSTGGVGFGARHGCNMPATAGDHEHHVRGGASVLPCHSNAPITAFIDANVSGLCWCACAEHHEAQEKEGGCSRGTPVMQAPAVCGASCHSTSCGHDHDVPTAALQLLMPRCGTKDGARFVYMGRLLAGLVSDCSLRALVTMS